MMPPNHHCAVSASTDEYAPVTLVLKKMYSTSPVTTTIQNMK